MHQAQFNSHLDAVVGTITLPYSIEVARLGIGCWAIGGPDDNLGMPMGWSTAEDTAARAGLDAAYDLGANLFDTADVYGHGHSERLIGGLIDHVPRASVAVVSKVGYFAGTAAHAYERHHMRAQLEQTLINLGTDYLDIYSLHNNYFGADDYLLEEAISTMRDFQREGLIRAVGMRGPHRYAPHRLTGAGGDKYVRFRGLFDAIAPDILSVRFNLLTPDTDGGIFDFARDHKIPILINKPLGQGLLSGKHAPDKPPTFGSGDHRTRKRWFTPEALHILHRELEPLRDRFGSDQLVRIALRYALQRDTNAAVLAGFTTPAQIRQNLTGLGLPLTPTDIRFIAETGRHTRQVLDALGGVFTDESETP